MSESTNGKRDGDAVILSGARTPIGRLLGAISSISATDLTGKGVPVSARTTEACWSILPTRLRGMSASRPTAPPTQIAYP